VADDSQTGVGSEHAFEAARRGRGAVSDDDLAGVLTVADAHSAPWWKLTHVDRVE
jgi:hypothetical protein